MKLFNKDLEKDIVVIAEIGVNHEGSLDSALKLITLAHESGADAVKFQSYTPERFIASNNAERMERVKRFHLSKEDHLKLISHSKNIGIPFFSTAVTEDWIPFLNENTSVIKIASGDITFEPIIRLAAQTGKPVILSTGGSSIKEVNQAIAWFKESSTHSDISKTLILMHCVSSYPTEIEDANLNSIKYLEKETGLNIGYSNHVEGIIAPIIAISLGAHIIEVHFTDTRENKIFHDHFLSLNPNELSELTKVAPLIKLSLGSLDKFCNNKEKENLLLIRKGVVAAENIIKGQIIEAKHLMYARPANYIDSSQLKMLIGKKSIKNILKGETLQFNMFN